VFLLIVKRGSFQPPNVGKPGSDGEPVCSRFFAFAQSAKAALRHVFTR
jgi:hypothetical protein